MQNWFQNRRAKSKQDAKKQAGAFNLLQATHQQNNYAQMNGMGPLSTDSVSPTYCTSDAFNMRDSAILDGPMSNGLGISQAENHARLLSHDFSMGNSHMSLDPLAKIPMQRQISQHPSSMGQENLEDDSNRRTLTQAQFDAFGQVNPFVSASAGPSGPTMSATITDPSEIYAADYNFEELCDFEFGNANTESVASAPMQQSQSTDSYASNTAVQGDLSASSSAGRAHAGAAPAASDGSAPSVSITPAKQEADTFDFGFSNQSSQLACSQSTSAEQWQPGQSIPVDMAALQQEFQEAAMRNRTHSVPAVNHTVNQNGYVEQPLSYPSEEAYRRDSSTTQLARSMQNFSMVGQRSAIPSTSIAVRRHRPRPAPLGGASLRSASYCGQLPTSPGPVAGSHNNLQSAGQTLRRIKSSQAMNGIASGRIQKNIGASQRSPSGYGVNDATSANRFARRVSSFTPAFANLAVSSASLAPPTPLSPTSYANLQSPGHAMRQQSISESDGDSMGHLVSSSNFSPPSTPIYAAQFARGRLGSAVITENTPPQSAPATQQSFPSTSFSQVASQIQAPMSSMPVLQSQPHGFVPMMPNEYPQMPNVVFSNQQQAMGNQYMTMPMSYIMTDNGEVHMGYPVVPPFAQQPQMQHQPGSHNAQQHPFVPSSSTSPGALVSSQVPKQPSSAADFFVHEYTPPQDVKQASTTPRKGVDSGPKNYTFSNHGPEYFEKNAKKTSENLSLSPSSSAGGSSTA